MHVDVRVAGPCDVAERARLIRQKVPELVDAGATVVREEWYGDALGHVVRQLASRSPMAGAWCRNCLNGVPAVTLTLYQTLEQAPRPFVDGLAAAAVLQLAFPRAGLPEP